MPLALKALLYYDVGVVFSIAAEKKEVTIRGAVTAIRKTLLKKVRNYKYW